MKGENGVETNLAEGREAAARAIADMIRQSSKAGQLLSKSEILGRWADQKLFPSPLANPAEEGEDILKKLVDGSEDLHELAAQKGSRSYYSSYFMTEAYARILLRKQGDPLRLIAEIVRQNSAFYPRPVPLDIFMQPPFELTRQDVLKDLEQMAVEEDYRDIKVTTTSASTVFLYSSLHLGPEHASMLAEWLDVGQFQNP